MTLYRASSIKRKRRTAAEMEAVRAAISDVLSAENPMTVRQVFYQLVGRGVIEKTEAEYKQTVVRLLTEMRRNGRIPFRWIADNSRWMRKPSSYDSLSDMLETTQLAYRRDLWNEQDAYVEIWLEKEALAGVVYKTTEAFDVPLMVTRGYPSVTFLWEAAHSIPDDKDVWVYYFGDYDPSGLDIARNVEEGLEQFGALVDFERVAVTMQQVNDWKLPVRPTKRTDSRTKRYGVGDSVELDTLSTRQLQALVEDCITRHIDSKTWARARIVENEERESLRQFLDKWNAA